MTATSRSTSVLALVVAAALLSVAAPAEAIYIVTPLTLETGTDHGEVGDDVDFTIGPNAENDTAQRDWSGKTVKVRYSYDQNENASGSADEPTSDAGYIERDLFDVVLDANASGRFTWTIAAEVADRNVNIFVEDETGERLAFAYVAVGNATPMMHILASSSGEGPADPEAGGELGPGSTDPAGEPSAGREAPAFGVILLIVVLSAAALALTMVARRS